MSRAEFENSIGKELFEAIEERATLLVKQNAYQVTNYCINWIPDLGEELARARDARKHSKTIDAEKGIGA